MNYKEVARALGKDPDKLRLGISTDFIPDNPDPNAPWVDIELPRQKDLNEDL